MTRLFGTDGIRGRAGSFPLDAVTVQRVGRALARNLGTPTRILIGRDTRCSGETIEASLAAGIGERGGQACSAGVITTPAIAVLVQRFGFSAGVVISASHNPHPDNGIKIFSGDGTKSDQQLESAIEKEVAEKSDEDIREPSAPAPDTTLREEYLRFLLSTIPPTLELSPFKVALDCANGAAYEVGPSLLARLGLNIDLMGASPNGENINQGCGSTHPEALARLVVRSGADLGAALDGDGDRLMLVDHQGKIVDGDGILLMCARRLQSEGRLPNPEVVATVMSNLALEKALENDGIRLSRTSVGDKYVSEELSRQSLPLGGEQSGHIIFSEYSFTGDGLLTLLQVLRVMAAEGKSLSELAHLEPYPQILVNVRVKDKPELATVPDIVRAIEEAKQQMGKRGRVLVRYSGTEPLLRIMLEGPDEREIRDLSELIGSATRRAIGDP